MKHSTEKKSWIFGEQATKKILFLGNIFYNSRKEGVNRLYRTEFKNYHPWMSCSELTKTYINNKKYQIPTQLFQLDPEILDIYKGFLSTKNTDIFDKKWGVSIAKDMVHYFPEYTSLVKDSWQLVQESQPWIGALSQKLIYEILPITSLIGNKCNGISFSDKRMIGTIFISHKPNEKYVSLILGETIVHEIAHQVLYIFQYGNRIVEDQDAWTYSGIRKTIRPAIASLHAGVAICYMIEYLKGIFKIFDQPEIKNFILARILQHRDDLSLTLNGLRKVKVSTIGERILNDISTVINDSLVSFKRTHI